MKLHTVQIFILLGAFLLAPEAFAGGCVNPRLGAGINYDPMFFDPIPIDRIGESKIGSVRLWAWWKHMEPVQGNIDYSWLDAQVSRALANGLDITLVFASIPSWANGSSPTCDFWGGACSRPPISTSYFYDFAYAVVSHYAGQIANFEVWNEPNLSIFWDGTFQDFIDDILINGSAAIRASNPSANVVGPSTLGSVARFQRSLEDACFALDTLSVHEYPNNTNQLVNRINSYAPAMAVTGCNKPLWVTEFGLDSSVIGEQAQAAEYVSAYEAIADIPQLDRIFLYRVQDHLPPAQQAYGIVRNAQNGYSHKPSFFAIQDTLLSWLSFCFEE